MTIPNKFDTYLFKLFQEAGAPLPPKPSTPIGGQTVDEPTSLGDTGAEDNAMSEFLDPDTNADEFDVKDGLGQAVDRVIQDFHTRMSQFASVVAPENLSGLSLPDLKDHVLEIKKFVDNIQNNTKQQAGEKALRDPAVVVAQYISEYAAKTAAFNELHSNLEEFVSSVEETERQIATLASKIDAFITDVGEDDNGGL